MLDPDNSAASPAFNLSELQQLLLGSFGGHQTGSLSALVERLRNTNEIPSTLRTPRSQLQVVQELLQTQHQATPLNAVPAGNPTRQQLQCIMNALACYENQPTSHPQHLTPEATLAYHEAQQALHVDQPVNAAALPILATHRSRPAANVTDAQRRLAYHTAGQLRPQLAHHAVFTASPAQRMNILLHLHSLTSSELQPSLPLTRSDLALFINQRDDNASSRLNYLQIMTATLRGSPNAVIVNQINALLSTQLASNISFAQVLVPHATEHISEAALLGTFNNLTPEAQQLFLLKWSRAILQISQLITSELAQASQLPSTSRPVPPSSRPTSSQQQQGPQVTPATDKAQPLTPNQQIINECRRTLERACGYEGVLRELDRKALEMSAFGFNPAPTEKFAELVNEGKKLLNKLNSHMPILLEDAQLIKEIQLAYASVLNAMLLGDIFSKINQKDQNPPPLSVKFAYYHSILAYIQNAPHPWDIDAIYQKINALFNKFSDVTDKHYHITTIPLERFTLADVPLNSRITLPHNYCLKALGLPPDANNAETSQAYKRLCLQHHPDKNLDNLEQANEMFLRLQIVAASLKGNSPSNSWC
ncbi:MAG: J domain-containing protein [Vibrionaceae bacterium]